MAQRLPANTAVRTVFFRPEPVEVLFEGADTDIYKPTKEFSKDLVDTLGEIEEDFCFLFVGHWLQGGLGHDRKDLGMLIKTFLKSVLIYKSFIRVFLRGRSFF